MQRFVVAGTAVAAASGPGPTTVEIAPGVHMPYANMGGSDGHYSNYTLWMELGGRGLDTALSYTAGDVQPKLGEAVRNSGIPRSELFVTTKVPCCPAALLQNYYCAAHEVAPQAGKDIDATLSAMGLEYADLILLHWPCEKEEDTWAAWRDMEQALAAGKTRAIGISNFNASAIEALLPGTSVKPAFNQVGFSVGNHASEETLNGRDDATRAKCEEHSITFGAYSPLDKGNALKHVEVEEIAQAHNVSTSTVAMRWIVQQGHTFTTASTKEEYDRSDLAALDIELTNDEMARLTAVTSAGQGDDVPLVV